MAVTVTVYRAHSADTLNTLLTTALAAVAALTDFDIKIEYDGVEFIGYLFV